MYVIFWMQNVGAFELQQISNQYLKTNFPFEGLWIQVCLSAITFLFEMSPQYLIPVADESVQETAV